NVFSHSQAFTASVCGYLGIRSCIIRQKDMCFHLWCFLCCFPSSPQPFSAVSVTAPLSPPTFCSISATILTCVL
ncbi:unnamed protein product, partial [Brassica rapa subsp. trilocularis]